MPLNGAEYSGKKIISITDDVSKEMIAGIIHKCWEWIYQWWQQNHHIKCAAQCKLPSHCILSQPKKCYLQYIITPKLKKVLSIRKELWKKQKSPSKLTSRHAIADKFHAKVGMLVLGCDISDDGQTTKDPPSNKTHGICCNKNASNYQS
jgi:hypothetical protein